MFRLGPTWLYERMGAQGRGGVIKERERKCGGIIGTKEPDVLCHVTIVWANALVYYIYFIIIMNIAWCVIRKGAPLLPSGDMQLLWSRWLLPSSPFMIVRGAHQLQRVGIRPKVFAYMFQCNQTNLLCVCVCAHASYCKLSLFVTNGSSVSNVLEE